MNRKDGMASGRIDIDAIRSCGAGLNTLEDCVESFLGVLALSDGQAFGLDLTVCVFLEGNTTTSLFYGRRRRKHVEKKLVVDFQK